MLTRIVLHNTWLYYFDAVFQCVILQCILCIPDDESMYSNPKDPTPDVEWNKELLMGKNIRFKMLIIRFQPKRKCPFGWRVPEKGMLLDDYIWQVCLETSNSGKTWESLLYHNNKVQFVFFHSVTKWFQYNKNPTFYFERVQFHNCTLISQNTVYIFNIQLRRNVGPSHTTFFFIFIFFFSDRMI